MKNIIAFGESLIRWDIHNDEVRRFPTGTALNFLTNLSVLSNHQLKLVTALPHSQDSQILKNHMKKYNIENHSHISETNILGSYQIFRTNTIFGWEVVYNRKNTCWNAFSKESSGISNDLLDGVDVFHFDGISLYSSNESLEFTKRVIEQVNKKNIKISFDYNFRQSMTDMNKGLVEVFESIVQNADFLNISYYDLINYFGVDSLEAAVATDKYKSMKKDIKIFGTKKTTVDDQLGIEAFSIIKGEINTTQVMLYTPNELIGQGDSFAAHIMSDALEDGKSIDLSKALKWSILKTKYIGDSTVPTSLEFEAVLRGKNVYR